MNPRKYIFFVVLGFAQSNYLLAEYRPSIFKSWWVAIKDVLDYGDQPDKLDKKLDFEVKLSNAKSLPEIEKLIKECEADPICAQILPTSDVQGYIQGARNHIIKQLQNMVNLALAKGGMGWGILDLRRGLNVANDEGETALHLLVASLEFSPRYERESIVNAIDSLIKNGANINSINRNGQTPLIFAARLGKIDVVKFLIEHGADVSIRDNKGKTSADYAKELEKLERKHPNHDTKNSSRH